MSLAAAFQGIERGIGLGMQYYDTIEGRARQKRLDALQVDRYNRQDMEVDRQFDYQQSRDNVTDDQWEQNFGLDTERLELARQTQKDTAKYQQGSLANAAETNSLRRTIFNDQVSERDRVKQRETDRGIMQTTLVGEDGNYITDSKALAERLNSNPMAMQAMLRRAVAEGWMTADRANNYTGMKVVDIDGSLGFLVAGQDGEGNPIKPGGGPITEGGTANPDDPALVIKPQQLGLMFGGEDFRDMMRSDALLNQETEAMTQSLNEGADATVASAERAVEGATAEIAQLETEIAELEEKQSLARPKVPLSTLQRATGAKDAPSRTENQIAEKRALLGNLEASRQKYLSDIQSIPQQAASDIEAYGQSQEIKRLSHGGNYANAKVKHGEKLAAAQTKAVEGAIKNFDTMASGLVKSVATKPDKKGKIKYGLSEIELQTGINLMSEEYRNKVAQGGAYKSLFANAIKVAAETQYRGNIEHLMRADGIAGVGMEKFKEITESPQLVRYDDATRGQIALDAAKRWATNPKRDIEAVLGEVMSGL